MFEKVANWQPFSNHRQAIDYRTNLTSSTSAAQALLKLLAKKEAA